MRFGVARSAFVFVTLCASGTFGQALVPQGGTMLQYAGYDYYLGPNPVALGSGFAPGSEPVPGSFGPYTNSYAFQGAQWSTSLSSAWSISSTPTTTNVTGEVVLWALADATGAAASATNDSYAQISFVFSAAQPVSFTASWYSPVGGPFFGTPGYLVLGDFSPYPASTMPTLAPMSNSGTLAAGTYGITMMVDLSVFAPQGGFINDVVGLAFELEATVIPAPAGSALLGLGALWACPSRRRRQA